MNPILSGRRLSLLAGTALTFASLVGAGSALADTTIGWYAAADVGHGPMATQTVKVTDVTLKSAANAAALPPLTSGTSATFKPDYSARGFVRAGYRFTDSLRAEIEVGTRPGKLIKGLAGVDTAGVGTIDKTSVMANLIADIKPQWALHPFIGIGAGALLAKADYSETATRNGHTQSYTVHEQKSVPAFQALAGASWLVTDHLRFDMTYRYLRTGNATYAVTATDQYGPTASPVTDSYTAKAAGSIEDHSITVGLRWIFGGEHHSRPMADDTAPMASHSESETPRAMPASLSTTAPAAPPAPAPAEPAQAPVPAPVADKVQAPAEAAPAAPLMSIPVPRRYTVYFPSEGARLDAVARSVIVTAAQYAKSAPAAKVAVTGYADTSGSSAYNLALSRRRAENVAAGLKDEGVPPPAISIAWRGEHDLAVKTRNGVHMAKNRRTTIDVAF